MKILIKLLVISCLLTLGCAEKKEKEQVLVEEIAVVSLEGMWKLKSGIWENEDGSILRYPEDSITEGEAYIIRSKTHYMLIGSAPKMNMYRSDMVEYAVDGDKITVNTVLSNLPDEAVFKDEVWSFKLDGSTMTSTFGNNKEVWEKIE